MRVSTCVHFELWRDIHHVLADGTSLEKSMQKENSSVERVGSVIWPQRRDHSRSEQAERTIFSGARGKSHLGVDTHNIETKGDRRRSR